MMTTKSQSQSLLLSHFASLQPYQHLNDRHHYHCYYAIQFRTLYAQYTLKCASHFAIDFLVFAFFSLSIQLTHSLSGNLIDH
jgi:hypothetical protein